MKPEKHIIKNIAIYLVLLISLTYITCITHIKPGKIGIVVNNLGSNKGVQENTLTIGFHFLPPWKSVYKFPTFQQNHEWKEGDKFIFQTSEGLPVKAEIGVSYHLKPEKINNLFCKYRKGIEEITDLYIKNILRDSINREASKVKIEDLFSQKKDSILSYVHSKLNDQLNEIGFVIDNIYIIGRLEVPEIVTDALNRKIEATQKAQQRENELRESEAQAKKTIAKAKGEAESLLISAKSKADANKLINMSLTPELLKWKQLEKWDGKLPNVLTGNEANMLINIKD